MKDTLRQLYNQYSDVILFIVCLFAANYLWKFTVSGDETIGDVYWLGLDITAPFAFLAEHTAAVSAAVLEWLRGEAVHYFPPYTIRFSSGFGVRIVWSCTPIKQGFIWLVIMLFAHGSWKKKLWFIPLGWAFIQLFNIMRIIVISLLCEHHSEMFSFWHEYIFKYIFYGMIFLLWVWWTECISKTREGRTMPETHS